MRVTFSVAVWKMRAKREARILENFATSTSGLNNTPTFFCA